MRVRQPQLLRPEDVLGLESVVGLEDVVRLESLLGLEGVLDPEQVSVVAARHRVLRVLGAPGTGRTTVALACVLERVRSGEATPDQCLVLTPSRSSADMLRTRLTTALGGTSAAPLARSLSSFGFGILAAAAAQRGEAPPRLLSGPEQDVVLGELLAGHAAEGIGPPWPASLQPALATRGFRQELRDLLMRAVELGLGPDELATLGRLHSRAEWVASAEVLREYDEVSALATPGAVDPAWLLRAAAGVVADPSIGETLTAGLHLVVVDDAQELTRAGLRLLRAMMDRAPALQCLLLGDPDAATQTFRGADPRILGADWGVLGDGPTLLLRTDHRCPPAVRAAADAVTEHIGVLGDGTHRSPSRRLTCDQGVSGGAVEVHQVCTVAEEVRLITDLLRRARLIQAVPWQRMAVITRGRDRTAALRRGLAAAGVPVGVDGAEVPVRDEPAVRPLLCLLEHVTGTSADDPPPADLALELLLSPVGGADSVTVRRLRRALRQAELAGGGDRTSEELLAAALATPTLLVDLAVDTRAALRVARMLAAGRRASAAHAGAEDLLWAIWDSAGVAQSWRTLALSGGPTGVRADRDLDAVVALFAAAERFSERLPGVSARRFLEHVRGQGVAEDTLAPRTRNLDVVEILTPQAAVGREWDLVVVAGVQEGVWPDLRLRGSLLGSTDLVDLVTGRVPGTGPATGTQAAALTATSWAATQARRQWRRAAVRAVEYDELRLFLVAATRARVRLVVTAVCNEDEQPSPLLDIVDPLPDDDGRSFTCADRLFTAAALAGELRRHAVDPESGERAAAISGLARLAAAGVPGAHPDQWWVLRSLSDHRSRRLPGQDITVTPSSLQGFRDCPLRWFLTTIGGQGPPEGPAAFGTVIHEVAAAHEGADAAALVAALDARWPHLGLREGWVADQQRALGEEMMVRLAQWFRESESEGWRRIGTEVPLRARIGTVVLRGTLDRVEVASDGGLRVIDYKTGSSKPATAEVAEHPQLGAYQLLLGQASAAVRDGSGRPAGSVPDSEVLAHLGGPVRSAALVHLGKAGLKGRPAVQKQPAVISADNPHWASDLVRSAGAEMAGAGFAAQPEPRRCQHCPVKSSCPAQPEGQVL